MLSDLFTEEELLQAIAEANDPMAPPEPDPADAPGYQAPEAHQSEHAVLYTPPKSLAGFLVADKFISLVVGPYGSTKTTAAIMRIAYKAKLQAPGRDGVRRSRCLWIRNTREQLRDSSIPDFLKWFPDGLAGAYAKTEMNFLLKFDDVECEVRFRGLDDAKDVRRLLSTQASFAVLDEFREIHPDIFEAVQGRLGRYPDKMMVPPNPAKGIPGGCCTEDGKLNKALWGASNPPDMDTYWEKLLSEPPSNVATFFQPSGMSPDADWVQWLDEGFYDDLAIGKTDDWIDIYIHAKFGRSLAGKAVFPGFNPDFHVAKQSLRPITSTNHPLIIGLDLGLTPACTINQQDMRGRFLTFAELTSENMGIVRFSREKLKPLLAQRFPGHPVLIVCDPAGTQRAQTDERTVIDILKSEGFKVIPARTNSIVARIGAVENLLAGQIDGGPRHLIDPSCTALIRGMRGGYRYKMSTKGEMDDKPEKNAASHLCDSHQYACLHVDAIGGSQITPPKRREIKVLPATAWT